MNRCRFTFASAFSGYLAVFFLFIAFFLSGASAYGETITQVIRLGLMVELSGTGALVGHDCLRGFELARHEFSNNDKLNSYRIEYYYEDNPGLPAVGVSAFRKLLTVNDVHAVLVKRSAIGMALSPIARQLKVPLLGLVGPASFTTTNPYAFRFWPGSEATGKKLAELAAKLGKQRAAVITLQDEWQLAVLDGYSGLFKAGGGVIVANETVVANETDFAAVASRVKQTNPDVIVVNVGPGQVGPLMRRLYEQGLHRQIIGNYYLQESSEIAKGGADAFAGAMLTDVVLAGKPAFTSRARAAYPDAPLNSVVYSCYTGLALVLQTLARENNIHDREGLYRALRSTNRLDFADGGVSVKDREIQYELGYFEINSGKVTPLP